jgi:4-amino-4-deoxy-L-arabinose transferase-like glycosyltransferase
MFSPTIVLAAGGGGLQLEDRSLSRTHGVLAGTLPALAGIAERHLLVKRRIDPACVLMVLQIAAILVLGAVTVSRFHVFAEVDERAHLAYVQEVAEHERIPWVGRDYVSWQELAIEQGTYPRRSQLDPRLLGLRGSSYEGWQPPLYYVLAAPAFLIPSNYRDKVYAVRVFDLFLLFAALVVSALLAKAVFGKRWRIAFCVVLSTFMWPGILVRATTVSNAALELPVVLLYVLAVWRATTKPSTRWLLAASGLLGLCVLTQLTLVCLAPLLAFPLVRQLYKDRVRLALGTAALTLALPLAMVVPWLASNETRYGALTASSLEERITGNGPAAPRFDLNAVSPGLARLTRVVLPQEWWQEYKGVLGVILVALPTLLLAAALPIMRRSRLPRTRSFGILAAPLLLGIATLVGISLLGAWPDALFPRYLNPMIPPFACFTVLAWRQSRIREGTLLGFAASSSLAATIIWFYMAGAYYFTNTVGGTFGIHAA